MRNRRLLPVLATVIATVALGCTTACTSGVGNGAKVASNSPSAGSGQRSASTHASGQPSTSPQSSQSPGTGTSSSATSTPSQPPSGAQTCAALAGKLTLQQQIGQLFMAGTSTSGMPLAQSKELAKLKVGSVLLLDQSTAGQATIRRVTDTIRQRIGTTDGIGLVLAVDQEGGLVQRLKGPGFDNIPTAVEQGKLSPATLTGDAAGWGGQLAGAGINVDLAPVADVVPPSMININQPIGVLDREYGTDPTRVEQHDVAFIAGMQKAKIGTSVKHFPNLGRVRGNTDFDRTVIDDQTTRDDPSLQPYRGAIRAGVDMVMVSSATYTKIDPNSPATFSKAVVTDMIRKDLKFNGVIVSDALEGKALGGTPESERALEFIRAGGDLALIGKPEAVAPMVQTVRSAADHDQGLRHRIEQSTVRVLIMKARYGLINCTA